MKRHQLRARVQFIVKLVSSFKHFYNIWHGWQVTLLRSVICINNISFGNYTKYAIYNTPNKVKFTYQPIQYLKLLNFVFFNLKETNHHEKLANLFSILLTHP